MKLRDLIRRPGNIADFTAGDGNWDATGMKKIYEPGFIPDGGWQTWELWARDQGKVAAILAGRAANIMSFQLRAKPELTDLQRQLRDAAGVYAAVCGAGRALGYVCAPSLFQKIVARCVDASPDIAAYERNRDLLYGALTDFGYTAVHPDGAFYLFVKALEEDANAFSDKAKELGL